MASPKKAKVLKMQDKYVASRLAGNTRTESRRLSGYSDATKVGDIERDGGPVEEKIRKALAAKGINWDSLAAEYVEGIEACKQPGAKDKDYNSLSKMLLQLGYLLGGGRKAPGVAIQINNNSSGIPGAGTSPDLIVRLEDIVKRLEIRASSIDVPGVLPGDTGDVNPETLHGVVEASPHSEGDGGGGGA